MSECVDEYKEMSLALAAIDDDDDVANAMEAMQKTFLRMEELKPKVDECLLEAQKGVRSPKKVKKVLLDFADAQQEYITSFRNFINALPDDPDDDPDDGNWGCLAVFFAACRDALSRFIQMVVNFFKALWDFICKVGGKLKELAVWICHKIAEGYRRFAKWVSMIDEAIVRWLENRS